MVNKHVFRFQVLQACVHRERWNWRIEELCCPMAWQCGYNQTPVSGFP